MSSVLRPFLLKITLFSILLFSLTLLWNRYTSGQMEVSHPLVITLYFYLSTVLTHYLILRAGKRSPAYSVRFYMASSFARMMISILILIAYVFLHRDGAVGFILAFAIYYLLYLSFEVVSLYRTQK